MHTRTLGATCAAALLSFTVAAADQAATQTPTQSPVQGGTPGASQQQTARPLPPATAGQITVTGCVTREVAGQFALSNAVPSSAAATASRTESAGAIASSTGTPASSGTTPGTAGTSGSPGRPATDQPASAASATAVRNATYSLTGDRENELEKYVGQRLEIVGTVDGAAAAGGSADTANVPGSSGAGEAGSAAAGGDASRAPVTRPEGSTSAGADANRGRVPGGAPASGHTPRLNIVSFRVAGGECQ